jgi:mannose-6-phosphate isomerase-like protein (cupin superfamily)
MMMRPIAFAALAFSLGMSATAQRIVSSADPICPEGTGPVRSTVLHSDSACSSFLLCIDAAVRPHLHRTHTEHVFVLDGTAEMMLGDSTRAIKAGDMILIPPGTPHAVKVTSPTPLRVISVQSPYFDGTDRVWLDE